MSLAPSPTNSTSLAALKERTKSLPADTPLSFFSAGGLDLMQRAATMLSCSTLVPTAYRNVIPDKKTGQMVRNESALSNCVLALNMAQRLGADPLMIMQNLYIVEGRPAWSSQFVIASINACGKFSPLRFKREDLGEKEVEWKITRWVDGPNGRRMPKDEIRKAKIRNMACTAWAIEKATGDTLEGPTVDMDMAVSEGWLGRNGSKWQTMPEVMLRYRAASFFGRLYAPELLMGLQTAEEVRDATIIMEPGEDGSFEMSLADLESGADAASDPDAQTGQSAGAESDTQAGAANAGASGRQKAARAKTAESARPDSQPAQAAPETAPGQAQKENAFATIACPRPKPDGSQRMVEKDDCHECPEKQGCPAWT